MSAWETRLEEVVDAAIAEGRVPTPTEINEALYGRRHNMINGRVTKARERMLRAAGYRMFVKNSLPGRWYPPGKTPPEGWTEVVPREAG